MKRIIMLGTGNAMVTKCYNTCFAIESNDKYFLVDAGGGNGILKQIEDAKIPWAEINNMFVTHAHTDHIMGVVWVVRKIATLMHNNKYSGEFHIYCHDESKKIIETMCDLLLIKKQKQYINERIFFDEIKDADTININGMKITCFDICSTKTKQFGFVAKDSDITLACLGDEPYNSICEKYVQNCDYMMAEAFCMYEDKEKYKPYEKHHSTAKDTAATAKKLGIKNLIIYHTEDDNLKDRKENYKKEALCEFDGNVYVPDDLDCIMLGKGH